MTWFKKKKKPVLEPRNRLDTYSEDFQTFWENYVVQPMGLIRGEVDKSFIHRIKGEERKEMMEFMRSCLTEDTKRLYVINALGELRDERSVNPLRALLKHQTDFGWKLSISEALYKINGEKSYFDVIEELFKSDDVKSKEFYKHHLFRLKSADSVRYLIDMLISQPHNERHQILSHLNWLKTGVQYSILDEHIPFDAEFFIENKDNEELLAQMAANIS